MTDGRLENEAAQQLADIGAIAPAACETVWRGTRDRDDIDVLEDRRSGVQFLSRSDHVHERFYQDKVHPELDQLGRRDRVVLAHQEDTARRVALMEPRVVNRDWLDVGTGAGAILDELVDLARSASAVEPQPDWFAALQGLGYPTFAALRDVGSDSYDLITLFHVLEHLTAPVDELREVVRALRPGGRVIIEVPHARDALITILRSEAFLRHTYWSEHLILHTRESLRRLLTTVGLEVVAIEGIQRYPVANHLHWLSEGRPGGHQSWAMLRDPALERAYADTLARNDATDTLLATATLRA